MSIPDFINGSFELLGGVFLLMCCYRAVKDKAVKGVSVIGVSFFALWGVWNLYFYSHLDQWISLIGSVSTTAINLLWIGLLIKYSRKQKVKA